MIPTSLSIHGQLMVTSEVTLAVPNIYSCGTMEPFGALSRFCSCHGLDPKRHLFRNPAFVCAMAEAFPREDGHGGLVCNLCESTCATEPISIHTCTSRVIEPKRFPELFSRDLMRGRRSCLMCGEFCDPMKPHVCCRPVAFSYVIDATDVGGVLWRDDKMIAVTKASRRVPNWAVILFEHDEEPGVIMRSMVFVAESDLPLGEGHMGLFARTALFPNGDDSRDDVYDGVPLLSLETVGTYTGARVKKGEEEGSGVAGVSMLTFTDDDGGVHRVDSKEVGGLTFLINQAHSPFKRILESGSVGHRAFIFAGCDAVFPGEELYWDYKAASDDPEDVFCRMVCLCGCKRPMVRYQE